MKLSLSSRLLLSLVVVFLLTTLCLGYILFETSEARFEKGRETQARTLARGLAEGSLDALAARDYELLERWLRASIPLPEYAYAYISRPNGIITAHTEPGLVATRTEAQRQLDETRVTRRTYREQPVVEVIQPVWLGRQHLANAHVAYYAEHENLLASGHAWVLSGALLLSLLILTTATYLILRRVVRPMTRLATLIDRSSMDGAPIDTALLVRTDEVGLLARNFDGLLTRLGQSYRDLAREKDRVQITLDSITDAVISTDDAGRVVYMNALAQTMTGWSLAAAAGKPADDIVALSEEGNTQPMRTRIGPCLQRGEDYVGKQQLALSARDGRDYVVLESVSTLRAGDGTVLGAVLVLRDITEVTQITRRLDYQATHDRVTGLINRYEFERRVELALDDARRSHSEHTICYIDLDQFKIINDTAGHAAGDHVLRTLANRLSQLNLCEGDNQLARLGGDEFAMLLLNCPLDRAATEAETILQAIKASPIEWESQSFEPSASIGVVAITPASENVIQLMKEADVACYSAKDEGRGRIFVFDASNGEDSMHQRDMLRATALRDALTSARLRLVAQPVVALADDDARPHYELLLRMIDHDGQIVSAGPYIPAAERFGVMQSIDRWVVDAALQLVNDPRHDIGNAILSINISGNSLGDDRFLAFVCEAMRTHEAPGSQICFEITETAAVSHLARAQAFIAALRELGCRFALDDFGSGLSSFMYLKKLPVDYLKIDGAFVKDMTEEPTDAAMVAAINEVGHVMGMKTIAEFASSEAIIARLRELGVDYAQGYALGKPQELTEILPRRRA
ncbi:MAG TPA: EAL domain-containing protein [Thioalkalivibrio sp.]|nr:EAL domain-containing protein [Thioalkalivibrio sp.]